MKEGATFGQEMSPLNMASINIWVDMGIIDLLRRKYPAELDRIGDTRSERELW